MKKPFSYIVISSLLLFCSCTTNVSENEAPTKFVPDHTLFIAGLVEFSPDTSHHYPEVVIGYFSDIRNTQNPDYLFNYPEIYNPTLLTQVVKTSYGFGLGFEPEEEAKVIVRGPIGETDEQRVTFNHETKGVYGDQNSSLALIPNGRYELTVELPGGQTYIANTYIPDAVNITVPDSIGIEVEYRPYGDGTPREKYKIRYPIIYNTPKNSFLTVIQNNSDKDRELLLMEPEENFLYTNRGPYLRTGAAYGVSISNTLQDTLYRSWIQRLDKPKIEIWMQRKNWIRFSFFSSGIGGNFFPLVDKFATDGSFSNKIEEDRLNAAAQNDSTYLFDVSTIRKLGDNGRVLPKDSSDVIGFFGGYFSHYHGTTVYPIRTFDLDSVLSVQGN